MCEWKRMKVSPKRMWTMWMYRENWMVEVCSDLLPFQLNVFSSKVIDSMNYKKRWWWWRECAVLWKIPYHSLSMNFPSLLNPLCYWVVFSGLWSILLKIFYPDWGVAQWGMYTFIHINTHVHIDNNRHCLWKQRNTIPVEDNFCICLSNSSTCILEWFITY